MVRTMTTSTLLDERCMTIWASPSGKRHVGGWFGMVLCGAFVDSHNGWKQKDLTSVRYLGRIAQMNTKYHYTNWCKRCINNYKDVIVDGDV